MATQTPNHKLTKPEMTDKADISMINPNWDTLDTALKANADSINEVKQNTDLTSVQNQITYASNITELTCYRQGLLVILNFKAITKSGWSGYAEDIVLPDYLKPRQIVTGSHRVHGSNDYALSINSSIGYNGNIATLCSGVSTQPVEFTFIYFCVGQVTA